MTNKIYRLRDHSDCAGQREYLMNEDGEIGVLENKKFTVPDGCCFDECKKRIVEENAPNLVAARKKFLRDFTAGKNCCKYWPLAIIGEEKL